MVVPARHRSPSGAHASPPTDLRYVRVEEFLKARALSDNTQKAYRRELHRFLDWKDLPWGNITPRHITLYKEYLRSTLTDSSLNRALSALKSFFDWLGRTYPDVLPLDPTKTVSLNKLPSPAGLERYRGGGGALCPIAAPLPTVRDSAILCVLFHGLRAGGGSPESGDSTAAGLPATGSKVSLFSRKRYQTTINPFLNHI
ncbi:MAG: Tyrosine recombinase XerC (plasmid) [Chroococcopsis gigantea SAG 12.99]|nr:Tyrosine recombinase XerC [Chroococcopsis gigantea SAG 12.99]